MPARYFIGVVHRRQADMSLDRRIVAFSHGREAAVRTLSPGDRVILYAPRTDFDGAPVQAFVAHARVTGEQVREIDFPMGTGFVRDAEFDAVTEAPVRPLLPELSFVKDPRHWGVAFRRGKFEIAQPDYLRIARAMGVEP